MSSIFEAPAEHAITGRVCVPVDPSEVESFDPAGVPTVGQLLRELDQNHSDSPSEEIKMDEDSQEEKVTKRSEPGEAFLLMAGPLEVRNLTSSTSTV